MELAELDYALPPDRIAQAPVPERTRARLLVLDRAVAGLRHGHVADLTTHLRPGDLLVLNDSRVVPARVHGRRPTGGRLELLLTRPLDPAGDWEALVGGTPRVGERVELPAATGEWVAPLGDGRWRVRLDVEDVPAWLVEHGEVPLPPYIRREAGATPADAERYQTVYARAPGSVAAPTAGLHLSHVLLQRLTDAGVAHTCITLHVGPGTFLPIRVERLADHRMLPEWYEVSPAAAGQIEAARARGGAVVAVGTTTVRALESAAGRGPLVPGRGEAELFIRPGYEFGTVDAMLTNFHLPRSSLLALVAAFAGWERIRDAYLEAIRLGYRFYSYGDAMLIR